MIDKTATSRTGEEEQKSFLDDQRQQMKLLKHAAEEVRKDTLRRRREEKEVDQHEKVDHSRRTVSSFWWRDMETGSRAKKARSGCPKKTTLRANIMLKCVVRKHRFQSLGAVNRMWNERISKVISLSTARSRIRRQSLQSRVARRKPLIGLNNRYATKYDRTKPLVGMCSYTFVNHAHDTLS